jgi:hypothetical protein
MRLISLSATVAATAAAVAVAGCGGNGGGYGSTGSPAPAERAGFAWLKAQAQPPGWKHASTATGARLAYPADWRSIETDPGTASAAPIGPRGYFAGYLNATPQGGHETLANWRRFRVAHVAAEGAHGVRLAAAATNLRFRDGRASCVIDSYSTRRMRFREIACIVAGRRVTTVVVGAAPAARWSREAPILERAITTFTS